MGGILHIASGEPFTPTITEDPLGMKGDQFDRPDVLTGPRCSGPLVNQGSPHGAEQPTLIVDDLKQPVLTGSVSLWVGQGTIAHFADLKIEP